MGALAPPENKSGGPGATRKHEKNEKYEKNIVFIIPKYEKMQSIPGNNKKQEHMMAGAPRGGGGRLVRLHRGCVFPILISFFLVLGSFFHFFLFITIKFFNIFFFLILWGLSPPRNKIWRPRGRRKTLTNYK